MSIRRLPDDPAYWEGLASRIQEVAWAQRASGSGRTLEWLAMRAPRLISVSLAAAAAVVIWLSVASRWIAPATEPNSWAAVLSPRDTIGRQIGAPRAPSLGALIATTIPDGAGRRQ